jgi:hypothetical protein
MNAYTVLLEAKLKEPIPTFCSTCELHALKNLELAHYVDRLQDENDELRKMMGWLSGVDGVFWYAKHVHYTLVWICLRN